MEPDALNVKDMVIYKKVSQDVIGTREFHIAKALLEGREEFSHDFQVGFSDHLTIFDSDVCQYETALAVVQHGGLNAKGRNVKCQRGRRVQNFCKCRKKKTCEHSCFGWPVDKGTWMEDWDVHVRDAVQAAEEAAVLPFIHGLLALSRSGAELHFMSTAAMASLLDIAILTGDKEAAAHVSRNCRVWPLRRWIGNDLAELVAKDFSRYSKVLFAAIQAGADLENVQVREVWGNSVCRSEGDMPLRVALFLRLKASQWQQLEDFFLQRQEKWRLMSMVIDNVLASRFLCKAGSCHKLCINKIRSAERAAVDISRFEAIFHSNLVNLLGLAILFGQHDCAIACVRQGIEVTSRASPAIACYEVTSRVSEDINSWIKRFWDGEMGEDEDVSFQMGPCWVQVAPASDCKSAACAAGRAAVRQIAAEKQVAIYQMMMKMSGEARPFPMELARSILKFSTVRVPKFVDQLGLSDLVEGWMNAGLEK
eukprot:Skav206721  [mRNA]  locus=scaffold967:179504:180943:- [translate_table: standard]